MVPGKLVQVFTTVACGFATLSMGSIFVWPSYTTPLLGANTTILTAPMSEMELSLLGSLPSLGAMAGPAIIGVLIETFGRKLGGAIASLTYVISWSIICFSTTSIPILVARFIGGIGGGACLVFPPIFIAEVVEDSIRGALASGPILFFNIGALSSYLLGWFVEYHTIVWANLACGIICCCLLVVVPESPVYLMKKNKEEQARASMALYRGVSASSPVVDKELARIRQQLAPNAVQKPVTEDAEEAEKEKLTCEEPEVSTEKKSAIKALFTQPQSRRAFWLVLTVLSMQVLMGLGPVQVYAKHIFREADPDKADLYSVIFAVIVVVGNSVAGAVTDMAGRRVLLITSSVLVSLCMATLGFLLQTKIAPGWVTVVMILLFCFCFMCGPGSVPYVLLAEVFSPEVQACASTLIIEWFWFVNFVNLGMFSLLSSLVGIHGAFYIYAGNGLILAVIGFIFVPETKGLANQQIQELFLRGRRK